MYIIHLRQPNHMFSTVFLFLFVLFFYPETFSHHKYPQITRGLYIQLRGIMNASLGMSEPTLMHSG